MLERPEPERPEPKPRARALTRLRRSAGIDAGRLRPYDSISSRATGGVRLKTVDSGGDSSDPGDSSDRGDSSDPRPSMT